MRPGAGNNFETAIRQIINQAVESTEVIDILMRRH